MRGQIHSENRGVRWRDFLGPARRERRVQPYRRLARVYDRLVGDALFPTIRDTFERCVRDFGIRFRLLADVGCGTGAFLRYLLRYSVPLVGVDASPHMLRIAARRLPGTSVRLFRQDIRRLRLPRPVDLITCNGDTLNYLLSPEDLALTLKGCGENLIRGGHLICDFLTGVPDGAECLSTLRMPTSNLAYVWNCQMDPRRRLTRVDVRCGRLTAAEWRWERETHLQRWHPVPEMLRLLDQAGFGVNGLWRLEGQGLALADNGWLKLMAYKK